MDAHAQHEIRAYAKTIGEKIVAQWVPTVWEAFFNYQMQSIRFSRIETEILNAIISNAGTRALKLAAKFGMLKSDRKGDLVPNRERTEFESKIRGLGLIVPWEPKSGQYSRGKRDTG